MTRSHLLTLLLATLALSCNSSIPVAPPTVVDFGPPVAPPPPEPAPTPPPIVQPPQASDEELLRAAVLFGSCVPDDGVQSALRSRVYERNASPLQTAMQSRDACLARRTDGCDGVEACLGVRADMTGPCDPICNGDTFVACDDSVQFSFNCATLGLACHPEEVCVAPDDPPVPCDVLGKSICLGGQPVYCGVSGYQRGVMCDSYGLACVDLDAETAICQGGGGECRSESYGPLGLDFMHNRLGCVDAETLQLCVGNGIHEVACGDLHPGLTCQIGVNGADFCGFAAECDPETSRASCDGTSVVTCFMGRRARVDCTSLGFSGCQDSGRGAICTP